MFKDREDAGRKLARYLEHLRGVDLVVLGLPRGGVPVAREVARALMAPLDVIVVRKLGVPYQPEVAMGAIGEGAILVLNHDVIKMAGVDQVQLAAVLRGERAELERRAKVFRGDRPPMPLKGRIALIVDDGLATGSTARAAAQVARAQGAKRVIVAAPVAPAEVSERLHDDADEVVVPWRPPHFAAIGDAYLDFSQIADSQVIDLLGKHAVVPFPSRPTVIEPARNGALTGRRTVDVVAGSLRLPGHLTIPAEAEGVVIFAHGSGSSRHSPRNQMVAETLNEAGLATLLFDLLTPSEAPDRAYVFDIELLAERLVGATKWLASQPGTARLPMGFFGASTGAAAALWAAADLGSDITAVVSRGGRPDLAGPRLAEVSAATLLIVGGDDETVLELNRQAQAELHCEHRLTVVPGATHLFEEPGALDMVAGLARDWFKAHFPIDLQIPSPSPR